MRSGPMSMTGRGREGEGQQRERDNKERGMAERGMAEGEGWQRERDGRGRETYITIRGLTHIAMRLSSTGVYSFDNLYTLWVSFD